MAAQNHRRNAFWGLAATITDILCGLYTSRLLLNHFGATYHGLTNAINNVLGLILALELVFLFANKKSYYQPLEDGDRRRLSIAYYRSQRSIWRICCLILLTIIAFTLVCPLFYLDQFTYWDTAVLAFALGLHTLIRTSTRADNGLLTADYKSYLVQILSMFTTLLTTLLCYLMIQWNFSLPAIKMMMALVLLIHPLFYLIYIRTHYHLLKPATNLPPHHTKPIVVAKRITNVILDRTDVLIVVIAATLTDVSIYAVYYMVARCITRCVNALFTGREAVYGHAFVQKDQHTVIRAYTQTHYYLANVLGIVFGIGVVMLSSFVTLYTKWITNVNYDRFWFGFSLLIAQILFCISDAQQKMIHSSAQYHHGRMLFDSITEAVINLVVSVALVAAFGIVGVALGTVVALIYRIIRLLIYRRKYVIKGSLWQAIRRYIPTVIMIGIALLTALYWDPHPTNKFEWAFNCLQIGVIFVLIDLVLNLIINFRRTKLLLINVNRHAKKFIRRGFRFVWRALGGIYQRGLVRAVRTYFAHKKAQAFEAAHPDLADLPYLTALGKLYLGTKMDIAHPQTLNEKINWLKINYQIDLITTMSDKVAAKEYVAEKLGAEYVIPTYGVWDSFDAIDWDSLPSSFVLKCTHDSGSIYLVKDKDQLDKKKARRHFEHYLQFEYWRKMREWGYKNVPPRIIAEKYLPTLGGRHSTEYKFTCFNGKVVFGTVCSGYPHGFNKRRVNDFYDPNFNHLPWRAWYRNDRHRPKKPAQWETMLAISEKFAQDLPYLRVDLYLVEDQIYFGEFTFYTGGGFIEFHPKKMDLILGQQLTLPTPRYESTTKPTATETTTHEPTVATPPVADEPNPDLSEEVDTDETID